LTTEDENAAADRRRRPRYAGTYPRRFHERYKELDPERFPAEIEHVRERGRTPAGQHVPVLAHEVMSALDLHPADAVADLTLGFGGHAGMILDHLGPAGRLVGFDVDQRELERTRARLEAVAAGRASYHRSSFAGIAKAMAKEGLAGFDAILADLGVSSMQIDDPERGFSFREDGPLDMRMDDRLPLGAADLVRTLDEAELGRSLRDLADEPDWKAIARLLVTKRQKAAPSRTHELAWLVLEAKGLHPLRWRAQLGLGPHAAHPAARTFQALRMLVNDELGALKELLRLAPWCLRPGGRIAIIAFHSGEDRLVKHAFHEGLDAGTYEAASEGVIRAGAEEVRANPRSSSAKLRWARRALDTTG
jgi:16S rRNA (cytosine1402-N4)-methyltransferase